MKHVVQFLNEQGKWEDYRAFEDKTRAHDVCRNKKRSTPRTTWRVEERGDER